MNGLENCVKWISYSVLAIEKNCNIEFYYILKEEKLNTESVYCKTNIDTTKFTT